MKKLIDYINWLDQEIVDGYIEAVNADTMWHDFLIALIAGAVLGLFLV